MDENASNDSSEEGEEIIERRARIKKERMEQRKNRPVQREDSASGNDSTNSEMNENGTPLVHQRSHTMDETLLINPSNHIKIEPSQPKPTLATRY